MEEEVKEKLSHEEFIEKLEILKRARDDGLISDEEFEEKKKELFKDMLNLFLPFKSPYFYYHGFSRISFYSN